MSALTPKQQRFVETFLLDLNATQAAIRAGYSERTANQQGPRLLDNEDVRKAIDAAKRERSEIAGLMPPGCSVVSLLRPRLIWLTSTRRPATSSRSTTGRAFGVRASSLALKLSFAGAGEDRKQVGHVKKIKLSDRLRRLELIGRHVRVNAFQEQIAVSGVDGLADRLLR
ncbi:terminase small subunit, partial [Bradyrhizobium jicamae]